MTKTQVVTNTPSETLTGLMTLTCEDKKAEIRLKAYADMIVRNKHGRIVAVRFGGYPEHVRAMSDCICAGCTLTVDTGKEIISLVCDKPNGYHRRISHDGLYAESILYLKDDEPKSLSLTGDNGEETTVNAKRNVYIFCEDDTPTAIFRELDRKLSVPLIPEFQDYFLRELQNRKILNKMKVWSPTGSFAAYHLEVTENETEIAKILEDGLKNGHIQIPGAVLGMDSEFASITGFTDYLQTFAGKIAGRIQSSFTPLFNPETDEISERLKIADHHIAEHAGYHLYPAQLASAEALKRVLDVDNIAMIVAECGTGKSKIGAAALFAKQNRKSFNAVICPSHMCKKWVRELEETLPDTYAFILKSISDAHKAYEAYLAGDKSVYVIISKERARDGYMHCPAVRWSKNKCAYLCPDCGEIIEMDVFDSGTKYRVTANQFFFQRETGANHKCENCGSLLWTALNPDKTAPEDTPWVKLGEYGFVYRKFAGQHLSRTKSQKVIHELERLVENPDAICIAKGALRKTPISSYIKKKIRRLHGLIIDELHEYTGDSGQGQAMMELAGAAKMVIGMTATLINGYAMGMFRLLYRLKSNLMLMDNKAYKDSKIFCEEYGVIEKIYEVAQSKGEYNAMSRVRKVKKRERLLPGVSPLVYSRFLMNNAVFLSLNDMGTVLPEYEEIPVSLWLPDEIEKEYYRIEDELKKIMKNDRKIAKKIMSSYLNLLSAYPDQPYGQEPILHPETGEPLVSPADTADFNTVLPKDEKLLELVGQKVKNGERVIIYTAWTRLDTQQKLLKLLSEKGIRAKVLDVSVKAENREDWVTKQVGNGLHVLITNPSLVQTGLDLNDFTTLIFFNVAYNLFVFRQASRRSWRINQKAPRIEVYLFYYDGTMQYRAVKLMASKLAAATVIEGNITEEGLAALSDCQDMTTQLARELTKGIRDESSSSGGMDDLSESFKKMAVLKSPEQKAEAASKLQLPESKPYPIQASVLSFSSETKSKRKQTDLDESQISLFDLLAS